MDFKILTSKLLDEYTQIVKESPLDKIDKIKKVEMPVDYFQFYKSVSSVYSSKIEGEDIDFDSFFKHKFLNIKFKPDYTRKADDLYDAYDFIDNHSLTFENVKKAHSILSSNLLPKSQQGLIRPNPMFVLNSKDQIEYVAAGPEKVKQELDKLFHDINILVNTDLNPFEIFYYASLLHLVFVKIHPFQDGNGRMARLIEKWFLIEKIQGYSGKFDDADDFYDDTISFDATMMNFIVIGEMVDKLSDSVILGTSEQIDWKKVKGFRNIIAHNYFGIDAEEVWQIINQVCLN